MFIQPVIVPIGDKLRPLMISALYGALKSNLVNFIKFLIHPIPNSKGIIRIKNSNSFGFKFFIYFNDVVN